MEKWMLDQDLGPYEARVPFDAIRDLKAEVKRLRAALHEIAEEAVTLADAIRIASDARDH